MSQNNVIESIKYLLRVNVLTSARRIINPILQFKKQPSIESIFRVWGPERAFDLTSPLAAVVEHAVWG